MLADRVRMGVSKNENIVYPLLIDDFEGGLSKWSDIPTLSSSYSITPTHRGRIGNCLFLNVTDGSPVGLCYGTTQGFTMSNGVKFSVWFTNDQPTDDAQGYIYFGMQDNSINNCYRIEIDYGGTYIRIELNKIVDGVGTNIAFNNASITEYSFTNYWSKIEVEWHLDGTIIVGVKNIPSSGISFSVVDTTHSSGFIGLGGDSEKSITNNFFDDFVIEGDV